MLAGLATGAQKMLRITTTAIALVGLATTAFALDVQVGDLTIDHPWSRATAATQANGAAYFTVTNAGAADRIVAAASPKAERVELHTHDMDGEGVMRMRQVEAIELPAGETTALQPGGLHIMLLGLESPLVEGETYPLTITLEEAGAVELEVQVEAVTYGVDGAMDHGEGHGN
jgi:copper(I)-binding protein